MPAFLPGLPKIDEYAAGFAGYVAKATAFEDPVAKLTGQLGDVLDLLGSLKPEKRLYRYAPQKWSVQEVLGHLTDAERIFAYRALRIGRGDATPLAGFDENTYVAAAQAERCDWDGLLFEFEHVRRASVLQFRHLPEPSWTALGTSNHAPISVRALAYIMIGHVAHHLDILRERYL